MTKRIKFNRETKDFDVWVDGQYVGSRDTHREAELLADETAYRIAKYAPLAVGDAVRIGASSRTGIVEGIGYTDVFVRLDDNGRLAAFQPQYVKRAA